MISSKIIRINSYIIHGLEQNNIINSTLLYTNWVPDDKVFYSTVSVWEVAIKHRIRPEQMPVPEEEFAGLCQKTGFDQLPIKNEHIFLLKTLERASNAPKHNDPFDRLLLAQAKYENIKLVTHDSMLPYYGEDCVMYV